MQGTERCWHGAIKRCFDVLVAGLMLAISAPLMVIIAVCVLIESPGPVFYRARRVGLNGRPLYVLKFRKMHAAAAGLPLTRADDERFTRIGRLLARTKLDELPQLFNVLGGGMSMIGPRPEDPYFVRRHHSAFATVLQARPGITGLSQLAFADESRLLERPDHVHYYEARILPQKLHLDRVYVTGWRPLLDLRIIFWTFATVALGVAVSVHRGTGRITVRRRPPLPAVALPQVAPVVPQVSAVVSVDSAPAVSADQVGV